MAPKKEKEIPLFRVWNLKTDKPAYLGVGKGLPEAEAQRLSDGLVDKSQIYKVYEPEEE